MRLNNYIAQAGIASRRSADELTREGNVTINGAVMKQPGYDVQEGDIVCVNGQRIGGSEKLCYYALNKPAGYVTTTSDEKGRPTVLSLLTDVEARVFPVGRLDIDTSGLLILTNDGASYRSCGWSGTWRYWSEALPKKATGQPAGCPVAFFHKEIPHQTCGGQHSIRAGARVRHTDQHLRRKEPPDQKDGRSCRS